MSLRLTTRKSRLADAVARSHLFEEVSESKPILPAPTLAMPRARRRRSVMAWGVVVIVLGGLGAWWGVQQAGSRTAVIAMAADVAFGETVTAEDFVQVSVPLEPGLAVTSWAQLPNLVGQRATTDLLKGTLLTSKALTSGQVTADGEAVVGVTVKPSQAPTMVLKPRDAVRLVVMPSTGGESLDLSSRPEGVDATVLSVGAVQSGGSRTVDVVVDVVDADPVAALAAAGRLVIVFQSRG